MNLQRKQSRHAEYSQIFIKSVKRFPLYYIIPIFCLILIGSVKGDASGISSDLSFNLSISQLNSIIKGGMDYIYPIMALALLLCLLDIGKIGFVITAPISIVIFLYAFSLTRISFEDHDLLLKLSVFFFVFLTFLVFLSSLALSRWDFVAVAKSSFLALAATIVAMNAYELAAGTGYASGARFFGIAGHPNFLGVQMAFCCLVGIGYQGRHPNYMNAIRLLLVLTSVYILYKSGSRTGILVLLTGILTIYAVNNPFKNVLFISVLIALSLLFMVSFGLLDRFFVEGVYARNELNTREGVWGDLWSVVKEAPFIGHGYLPESTANSWLRGWATVGFVYPALLMAVLFAFSIQIFRSFGTVDVKKASMFIGIFFGLTVGSVLEGYLLDANSLPIHAWFLSLITSSIYLKLSSRDPGIIRRTRRRDSAPHERLARGRASNRRSVTQ